MRIVLKKLSSLSLSIFFCMAFCLFALPAAAQGAAADANASTIRVLLSAGDVSSIEFSIRGVYSIAERPDLYQLANGSYRVSNSGGVLCLANADTGQTIASGLRTVTIEEHANDGGFNLVSLAAKGSSRQYLGSMKFWPDGSYVMAVNHIFLEKYLYGVVANEMGSSFPLEALKAQAVAARCYAYKSLEGVRGERYDITDNAGTQAYSGYTSSSKIQQAVDDTSKQVLTYDGNVITAYFAASNGGQTDRTENVWSASLPYFKIQDDPYDLMKGPSQTVSFPVGTATDKPEDMPTLPLQALAIAKISGASRVTMYRRPDTGSTQALMLKRNAVVWIYEMNSSWVKAKSGNTIGFIPTQYVRIYTLQALVPSSGRKLLKAPSTRSGAFLTLPKNAVVTLQSYGTWCVVNYNGTIGYIASKYLRLAVHTAPETIRPEAGNTFTVTSRTYLKASAKSGSKSLARLNAGTRITFVSAQAGWYKVSVGGKTGYIPSKYLQIVIPSLVLTSGGFGSTPAPSNDLRYSQDVMDARLTDFIKTMAVKELALSNASLPDGQKYDTAASNIQIKSIVDMSCYQTEHKPYCLHEAGSTDAPHEASDCPSIDFTGAKLTVMLKVHKENAAKQGGYDNLDYTFRFQFYIPDYLKSDAYPQWKVFTKSYRIYAAERGKDANGTDCFNLINRRYGHGVGMSQWGAYQRALSSDPNVNSYTNILAFYYPGASIATLDISPAPLTAVPAPTPIETTIPSASPEPQGVQTS